MKKVLFILFGIVLLTGCGSSSVNTDSKLYKIKNNMLSEVDNYSYDVVMTSETGFIDVDTTMSCKNDNKNKVVYCYSSTFGVETEEYIDFNSKYDYSKVTTLYGGAESNGKWTKKKLGNVDDNSYLSLSDYVYDLTESQVDGGILYKGVIDSKKLVSAQNDSSININDVIGDDIEIEIFVNSSNYIESMKYSMEVMGINQRVSINFNNFNTTGDVSIPSDIK